MVRSSARSLRWTALAIKTTSFTVAACSGDEPRSAPASSGSAGAPSAAGAAPVAPGGTSSGGLAGMAGMAGIAGMAGTGGVPAVESCAACGARECQAELDACSSNKECAPWLSCVTACTSAGCVAACDEQHADVSRVYRGVYACWCSRCANECSLAQSCDKQCVDDDALPPTETVPPTLADTGLFASSALAQNIRHYVPKYPLWSDGADKDRFIYVPKCSTVDTDDMDHWQVPVGARLWKTFVVAGARIETRLIHRYGPGQGDWLFAAYQWSQSAPEDPAAAMPVPDGVTNASGTAHDIPSEKECLNCHGKLRERVLGFSALQLSHAGVSEDLTIERLSNRGWLTVPAPAGFEVPGTPVQQAALGYLHGNCGGCHNQNGQLPAGSPLLLFLSVSQPDYAQTDTVVSTVGVGTFGEEPATLGKPRVAPMDPANSSLLIRMQARGTELQMPPLVTTSSKLADTQRGVADVAAWINSFQ